MINSDDLDPPRPALKPLDLQQLSLEELQDYILALEAEIARVETMIEKKNIHRNDIEILFGSPKS